MHGQENHSSQTFNQPPPASALPPPPPPSHRGPYHHAPAVSSGMSSSQPYYLHHLQPPQVIGSNQTSYPYPNSQQHVQWSSSQNVHQHPPHPPFSSSPSFLTSDPFGSGTLPPPPPPPMGPLPPPPPRPPPLPMSSPPKVPPLPLPSPPSDVYLENDYSQSLKEFLDGDKLVVGPSEDRNAHQNEVPCYHNEDNVPELESMDVVVAHSPAGSDMEMEDDITHPDEEKKDRLLTDSNGWGTSISQEDLVKEQPQSLQHTGEHRVPEDFQHENLLYAEDSVLKDQEGGSEEGTHCDFLVTRKVFSEVNESGMKKKGQTEQPLEASVNESSSQIQNKNSSQPSIPVVANAFNLLQGYASDNVSENDGENILDDGSPDLNGGSSNFDAQKECNFGSKVRAESLSDSNKYMLPKSMIESPRNVMEADKSRRGQESGTASAAVQSKGPSRGCDAYIGPEGANFQKQDMKSNNPSETKVDEYGRLVKQGSCDSDNSDSPRYTRRHARRARKRSSSRSRSRSPHDRRRSPRRRKGRRGRSRSYSPKRRRSRSRSPVSRRDTEFSGDKQRRRSRSRSPVSRRDTEFSGDKQRRRSRSRSPVLRRDTEFSGDKQRREKGQLPECLDFLRGKCYRGASCRFLHNEVAKSERLRHNRSKPQSPLRIPDVYVEDKVLYDKEVKDEGLTQELHVDSMSPLKLSSLSGYSDKLPQTVDQQGKTKGDSLASESSSPVQASAVSSAHLSADAKQGPTSLLVSVESPLTKPCPTEEVQSQSFMELPASVANFPSQFTLPLPPASQVTTSAPSGQDYNFHSTLENHSLYQAPASFQHSHFPGSSNPLPNSFLPPPPPFPPPHHLPVNTWNGLPSYTSMGAYPTELHNRSQTFQYQAYPFPREPDQMLQSFPQSQPCSSFGPSDSNSSHGHPNFQRNSYGLQYSSAGGVPAQFAQPEKVSSTASGIHPDFLERNQPSYVHSFTGSQIENHFNPCASNFDLPPSSTTKNTIPSSSSGLPAQSVLPKTVGDQYDPLFDSIEPVSTSLSRANHKKHETPGDSDNMAGFSGPGRVNEEVIKQEGGAALSANGSVENEEFGETADAEVGDVLSGSLSAPNDATNTDAGEFEIDQVTGSGKKRKGNGTRSMKLFKISIAGFVKDVLKPSWRQGNMSKEAFKTIVKKTVDKVSGAMKGHHVPKSQANIDHYIDSSRGKLTKLVMGYVDKYVKA